MKYFYLTALYIFVTFINTPASSANVVGRELAPVATTHANHDKVGSHGMVVFSDGTDLYASHLPLYYSPHDYQLIYKIDSSYKALVLESLDLDHAGAFSQSSMVTLLPAIFDLNKLINGEQFSIPAEFFKGHFERGGNQWLSESKLTFVELLFKRRVSKQYKRQHVDVDAPNDPSANSWSIIELGDSLLYVHSVGTRPSYDALVLVKGCSEPVIKPTETHVPSVEQLNAAFAVCDLYSLLYFETQDFAL